MKFNYLVIIALCCFNLLKAQDSLKVETATDTFKPVRYVITYDDIYMDQKNTKWLLKVDALGLLGPVLGNDHTQRPYGIEFERKLGKELSLNIGVSTNTNLISFANGVNDLTTIKYSIEPRWYLGMKKGIDAGERGNNLNGQYVSLKAGFYQNIEDYSSIICLGGGCPLFNLNNLPQYSISANYGIQKRVFNNWYINYNIGLGVEVEKIYKQDFWSILPEPKMKPSLIIQNQVTLGLAFGGTKRQKLNKCEFYRCFEEETTLWKVDLKNVLGEFLEDKTLMGLGLAYERKIYNSAFSINSEVKGFSKSESIRNFIDNDRFIYGFSEHFPRGLNGGFSSNGNGQVNNYGASLSIEPRWYFNLKRRIAKGKSVNNLSGSYLSIEFRHDLAQFDFKNIRIGTGDKSFSQNSTFILPKIGLQKRIFKNGYFDLNLSPLWYGNSIIKGDNGSVGKRQTPISKHDGLWLDFELGLAF